MSISTIPDIVEKYINHYYTILHSNITEESANEFFYDKF